MKKMQLKKATEYIAEKLRDRRIRKRFIILASLVVFVTTYALILPALTLETQAAKEMAGIRTASGSTGGVYTESSSSHSSESTSSGSESSSSSNDSGASSGEASGSESSAASSNEGTASDSSASTSGSEASDASNEGGQDNASAEASSDSDDSSESSESGASNDEKSETAVDRASESDNASDEGESAASADKDAEGSDTDVSDEVKTETESPKTASGGSSSQSDASDDDNSGFNLLDLLLPIISDDHRSSVSGDTEAVFENKEYIVTVKAAEGTAVPAGAELTVTELGKKSNEYRSYIEMLSEKLDELELDYYDTTVFTCYELELTKDGENVIPDGPVDVEIEFKHSDMEVSGEYCFGLTFTEDEDETEVHFVDRSIQGRWDVPAVTVEKNADGEADVITHLYFDNYEMQGDDMPNVIAVAAAEMTKDDAAIIHELAESERTERGEELISEETETAHEDAADEPTNAPVVSEEKAAYDIHTVEGNGFTLTAKVSSDAGIPADAQLLVCDLDDSLYADYFKKTKKALSGAKINAARFFDISFVVTDEDTGRHEVLTPAVPVEITAEISVTEAYDTVKVISFVTRAGEIINADAAGSNVMFEAEDSSVYGILWMAEPKRTVRYGIDRGEKAEISEIFETLGINLDGREVSSVESDSPVITVREHKQVLGFIGSHRWTVKCNSVFNEPVTLNVTLNDGTVYVITLVYEGRPTYTLRAEGETYRITLVYDDAANIPEGAELTAREIDPESDEYAQYAGKAADTLGSDMNDEKYARFFDITIMHAGAEIQPAAAVDVKIELSDIPEMAETQVVHFGEEESVLESSVLAADEGSLVAFETDGFSVFGIVGTTIEKNVLASDGHNYKVSVTYGDDAGIPEGADLSVVEIAPHLEGTDGNTPYDVYIEKTRETLGLDTGAFAYARFFDIKIIDENGDKVEISAPVEVKIELADKDESAEAAAKTQVVHFADGAKAGDVIGGLKVEGGAVSFEAPGFSAYAIVEGPGAVPVGWHRISSMEEFMSMGRDGLYIGHPDGYYYANTLTGDSTRTGITKTKPAQSFPADSAALYFFEQCGENQVYAYCLGADNTKQYVYNGGNNSLSFTTEDNKTAFTVTRNSNGTFTFNNGAWYWNMQGGANGARFCSYNKVGDTNNNVNLWYYVEAEEDPYGLDGMSYGLMSWNGGVAGKAVMNTASAENTLDAKSMTVMSTSNNSSQLFVPNDSEISMWTFHWIEADKYLLSTVADGSTKYLKIGESGVTLISSAEEASQIQVVPGSGIHAGEICLKDGTATLTYSGTAAGGFSVGGSVGSEWLRLVELSELTKEYFMTYSASKVSVSDESITNGSRVIVYTRSWNDEKLKYDYYAISSDGTLVPVYESGDSIEWVSGQINTLLWNFVEYYWEDTTDPNFYYELYNQYSEKFIAPQITGSQILSDDTIGINLNGRRDGKYYSTILAWDEGDYSYVGLKVEDGRIVACPRSEAMDFYFAVMQDLNVDDTLTTVSTVDHTQYGITMKIKNFDTREEMSDFLDNDDGGAVTTLQQGLLSTDITGGYPSATASGTSLGSLFAGATEVNHLFIKSTYSETGYFEYDSAQNFASLKGTDFVVYKELGSYDSGGNKPTLKHGQFFPFNDLKPGVFASTNGKNLYASTGERLPDGDARKYETLYSVEYDKEKADCYFGVELEAAFTQTPSGLDDWGHDIIFEFTGDDDFWLYVDGELVIDLGGIHSAVPGSVNFRTGSVNVNGTSTTLRELYESNYRTRNPKASDEKVAAFLSKYFEGEGTVFKDDTIHTMNIFYMERGAGASNLHMRFNLAAVKKGTVQLSKTLSGVDEKGVLAEFPYQIYYKKDGDTEYLLKNAVEHSSTQNDNYVYYNDTINPVKYKTSVNIDGTTYNDVFFLKPKETADISFPEGMTSYRIVECGVNTDVYSGVSVNGEPVEGTAVNGSANREDYGIAYATTDERPKVNYINTVDQSALRTLTIEKRLFKEDGITPLTHAKDSTVFNFRLYLASEYDEPDAANMHVYHIKDPEGCYCTWDRQLKKPVRIVDEEGHGYTDYTAMTTEQQNNLASFTTGIYGTISEIPVGYTVEIRDVLAGTKFRAVERPDEIPDGYSFQKYIYNGTVSGNTAYEGIADTVTADTNPNVVVCNLKGWGLRVNKVWRDADYMSDRDPAYFAVFTRNGSGLHMVEGSVRRIAYSAKPQTMYWYYDHLPVAGTTGVGDYFIREVTLSASEPTVSADGVVTNYGDVTALEGGDETELYGTPKGETGRSRFTYTVNYDGGAISSESNVRVDTVTNDRPGIILKKQDWNGGPLAGAVFTLKDENDNTLGTFTSDEEGVITTAFLSGGKEYTLTETVAPAGYHGPEKDIKIMMNGSLTVSGPDEEYYTVTQANGTELASLTVKNRPYTLEAVKRDATTLEPLSGVVFALHRQVTVGDVTAIDLNPMPGYESLTTDENGLIPMIDGTLPAGTYELREKVPLEGYKPLGEYIRFTVSPTGDVTLDNAVEGVTIETGTAEDGAVKYVMTVNNIQDKKVSFKKVDITNVMGSALEGAEFDLYRVTVSGDKATRQTPALYTGLKSAADGLIEDSHGNTVFELPTGTYHLVETKAPDGYILKDEAVVVTVMPNDVTYDEGTNISSNGTGRSFDEETQVYTLKISNSSGVELPSTGGFGATPFYVLGAALLLGAAVTLTVRRRMRTHG